MISGLDHLVILVSDLAQATHDYERLGFAVTPGGEHADGLTRNALIPFHDGSYLELVAFLNPEDPRDNVWGWRRFAATGGLIDHCVASDDLAADVRRLREAGFEVDGPADGGRRLPEGEEIRWLSASVAQEGRVLPFLIEDLTPRARRVPAGRFAEHPNGATGVSVLEISAPDQTEAARSYAALVGNPVDRENGEATVRLGRHSVTFVGSSADTVGPGPCAVALVAGAKDESELNPDLCHGARILLG